MKLLHLICVVVVICSMVATTLADVKHLLSNDPYLLPYTNVEKLTTTTYPPPPRPYVFSYDAGRFPGDIDRHHSEVSDGSGTVRGTFSYVDPRHQVRTVDYIADQNGFHPQLSHPSNAIEQSEAVQKATQRHLALYQRIADSHDHPQAIAPYLPLDTEAVASAKERHLNLYERIAAEHAQIAAERASLRAAFEGTSEVNKEH